MESEPCAYRAEIGEQSRGNPAPGCVLAAKASNSLAEFPVSTAQGETQGHIVGTCSRSSHCPPAPVAMGLRRLLACQPHHQLPAPASLRQQDLSGCSAHACRPKFWETDAERGPHLTPAGTAGSVPRVPCSSLFAADAELQLPPRECANLLMSASFPPFLTPLLPCWFWDHVQVKLPGDLILGETQTNTNSKGGSWGRTKNDVAGRLAPADFIQAGKDRTRPMSHKPCPLSRKHF